jgi:F-type H+-transporting ATPase subunit a
MFIVVNNLIGLIPGIVTPTSHPVVPLGLAVLTFVYYNYHGIRIQGFIPYVKHFGGPVLWMAPLLFPMELVSQFARPLALTIRLYANMFASDLLTMVAFSMVPLAMPSLLLGLHFCISLLQAYVFMLLAIIYLSEANAHPE